MIAVCFSTLLIVCSFGQGLLAFNDVYAVVEQACVTLGDVGVDCVTCLQQFLCEEGRAFSSMPRCFPGLFVDDHQLSWRSVSVYAQHRFRESSFAFFVGLGITLLVGAGIGRASSLKSRMRSKGWAVALLALVGLYALQFRERFSFTRPHVPSPVSGACISRVALASIVGFVLTIAGAVVFDWLKGVREKRVMRAGLKQDKVRRYSLKEHAAWALELALLSALNCMVTYTIDSASLS